ncbi:hypothetical protein LEMLEM_LOCUS22151, partial [Lemmus lemmus]
MPLACPPASDCARVLAVQGQSGGRQVKARRAASCFLSQPRRVEASRGTPCPLPQLCMFAAASPPGSMHPSCRN